MKKIAICYWGMTRSTKAVYNSHHNNLFNVLRANNIDYNVFMHTWKTDDNTNIIWETITDIPIDYEEYKLLNPHYYAIDNQDDFLETIYFNDYFDQELYDKYGGDTHHEWRPRLIINHLCALESQKRCFEMVRKTNINFDYVIFIRPDVEISNKINMEWLNITFDIIVPNYEFNEGVNDKFAIIPFDIAHHYANRIDELADFRKNHGRIVSEKYVQFIIIKYYKCVHLINFYIKIVRPDSLDTNNIVV